MRRTPQEKKQLSLRKDRRNVYGEPPHAARKAIPLRKKLRNRANRHQQERSIPAAPLSLTENEADAMESSMLHKAPKIWKKLRDDTLGNVIAWKLDQRIQSHSRKIRSKTLRAFRDGYFCGECPTCASNVYLVPGRHGREHYGLFCAVGEGPLDSTFSKVEIHRCQPAELPAIAADLHASCANPPDAWLGDWLCRLFGTCTCPKCSRRLSIPDAVAAVETLSRVLAANGNLPSRPARLSGLRQWLYFQP